MTLNHVEEITEESFCCLYSVISIILICLTRVFAYSTFDLDLWPFRKSAKRIYPSHRLLKRLCRKGLRHVRDMLKPSPKGHLWVTFFKPIPHFFLFQKPVLFRLMKRKKWPSEIKKVKYFSNLSPAKKVRVTAQKSEGQVTLGWGFRSIPHVPQTPCT